MGRCLFVASKRYEELAQHIIYQLLADSTAPEAGYSDARFLRDYAKFGQVLLQEFLPALLPEIRSIVQAYYLPDLKRICKQALVDRANDMSDWKMYQTRKATNVPPPSHFAVARGPFNNKKNSTLHNCILASPHYMVSPVLLLVNYFKHDCPPSWRMLMDYFFIFPGSLTSTKELEHFLRYVDNSQIERAKSLLKQQGSHQVFVLSKISMIDQVFLCNLE